MDVLKEIGIQQWRVRRSPDANDGAEPSARQEPSANKEPSARQEPSANKEPAIVSTPDGSGVTEDQPTQVWESPAPAPAVEVAPEEVPTQAADPVPDVVAPPADEVLQAAPHTSANATSTTAPPVTNRVPPASWQDLVGTLESGALCAACKGKSVVLGDGDQQADWVFVFDAPSSRDIAQQHLLSGRAGKLFDAILGAVRRDRSSVYLTSVFKCPPTEDLSLSPGCDRMLAQQLQLIKPRAIFAFGEFAAQSVLRSNDDLAALRGQPRPLAGTNSQVVSSYSIAQMLESPHLKAQVWEDLKMCLTLLAQP